MRVGVVGGGLMGAGIAEVCARSRRRRDGGRGSTASARAGACGDRALARPRACARASSTRGDRDGGAASGSRYATELGPRRRRRGDRGDRRGRAASSASCSRALDAMLPDAEFLASNTSSVPIMKLGAETRHPERVLGLHFFNPVPVLPLVEVVRSIMTSEETLQKRARVRRGHARQDHDRLPGPRRLRRQRAADPVPPVGDPDVRVGLRVQGGHRRRAWSRAARTRWARSRSPT